MQNSKISILRQLLQRHAKIIISFTVIALIFLVFALLIYAYLIPQNSNPVWKELADFFIAISETILGAGLIIGGMNLIFEEFRQEQEDKDRASHYRKEMVETLQTLHSEVQLARVLIRTHKSAKTYGEQIRERILPAIISLKDLRRSAMDTYNHPLKNEIIPPFRVSLHFMIAYLSVLVEEFESNYHHFSNLQNCQEALAVRMRNLFVEVAEDKLGSGIFSQKKSNFLEQAQDLFEQTDKPQYVNEVWKEIEQLPHTSDFIDDTITQKDNRSQYAQSFLAHYVHCKKILKFNTVDERFIHAKTFSDYASVLRQNDKKENSNLSQTTKISLTRLIMQNELGFEFDHKISFS